jgi:tetratricopeptide (TPR) repeat protein
MKGKRKRTRHRKRKISGGAELSGLSAPMQIVWAFVARLTVYAAIIGLSCEGPLTHGDQGPQKTEAPSNSTKLTVPQTASSALTPQREVAALKKEELELVERLMREFPDVVDPIVLMGNVQGRHGNTTGAIRFWRKALDLSPRRADVYSGMGWLAMRKGECEEAILHWRKAVEIAPQMPGLHNSIARALTVLGRRDEAIEELERDIQISPESSLSYFLLGQEYLQQKQYKKAKRNYETAISLQPDLTNAYYGLFTVCSRLKQRTKALEYLAMFKKLEAEDETKEKKLLEGRSKAADDLAKMRNDVAETYMYAERIYQALGQAQRTEKLLERAASLAPNNAACRMKLASFYRMNNRLPEALQMCEKLCEIEPKNGVHHLNIGILCAKLNRFADAEEAFREAIALTPESSAGYRSLAKLLLDAGRKLPEARELAERAVALEASAADYFVLGWACDRNGDRDSAISAVKRALELDPGNPKYKQVYERIQKKELE